MCMFWWPLSVPFFVRLLFVFRHSNEVNPIASTSEWNRLKLWMIFVWCKKIRLIRTCVPESYRRSWTMKQDKLYLRFDTKKKKKMVQPSSVVSVEKWFAAKLTYTNIKEYCCPSEINNFTWFSTIYTSIKRNNIQWLFRFWKKHSFEFWKWWKWFLVYKLTSISCCQLYVCMDHTIFLRLTRVCSFIIDIKWFIIRTATILWTCKIDCFCDLVDLQSVGFVWTE